MNLSAFMEANALNGLLGLVFLLGGYVVFDLITPWEFGKIFEKGELTNGGVVIAAFLLSLALVIGMTAG